MARKGNHRNKLAGSVYRRLKADIFDFRLPPGARFSENDVARRAHVSRTPVREALFQLEREGYLEVHTKSGWSVAAGFAQSTSCTLRVVPNALHAQAVRGQSAARSPAEKICWCRRKRLTDGARVAKLDEEFHAQLVAAAGNGELARVHQQITERIRIVRRLDFTHPERVIYTYLEHAQILRAILARKAARALALLTAHIGSSKMEVRKISLHRLHLAQLDGRRQRRKV
jgi:DNA-binding GntR family transcriptional regulator